MSNFTMTGNVVHVNINAIGKFGIRQCLSMGHDNSISCDVIDVVQDNTEYHNDKFLIIYRSWLLHSFYTGTEFVGPSKRLVVGALPFFSWLIGCFLIEGYAYLIRNRVYFELVSTIITACTLPLLWLVPIAKYTTKCTWMSRPINQNSVCMRKWILS